MDKSHIQELTEINIRGQLKVIKTDWLYLIDNHLEKLNRLA